MPPNIEDILTTEKLPTSSVSCSTVLLSSLCWAFLYCLSYLAAGSRKTLFSGIVQCIPLIHGLIVAVLSWKAINERPHPFLESGESNTPLHNLVMVISVGFFFYDFVRLLLYKLEPAIMVVHHGFGVIVIGGALITQEGGAEMMVGMFLLESTSPLFQFRQILRLTKYKDGFFYKIVEWTFVSMFTLIRVFACGLVTLIAVFDPNTNLHIRFTFITFYSLSLAMVYYTWVYIIKKYFKKPKSF